MNIPAKPGKDRSSNGNKACRGGRTRRTKEDLLAMLEVCRAFIERYTSHAIWCARLKSEQSGAALLESCTCGYDQALNRYKRAMEDPALAKVLGKQSNPFSAERLHV